MNLRNVLVTGAAGFIGGHLCHELMRLNFGEIIGVDCLRSGTWDRTPDSVRRVEREISSISLDEWIELLSEVDVLFHLAAEKHNPSISTPQRLISTNVSATETVIRAAAIANVGRVVFTSSLYAYGSMGPDSMSEADVPRPTTLYGASKLMGEHILASVDLELGLSWNCARLFFIYGPHQFAEGGYKSVIVSNFQRIISGKKPIIRGDGLQSLDYVFIDDCIDALVTLATADSDRNVINVATGSPTSLWDLTTMMLRIADSPLQPTFAPHDWTFGSSRFGSTVAAKSLFGWESKTSIYQGLTNTFNSI